MDFMKDIPDGYYGLCICDPPYGINYDTDRTYPKKDRSAEYNQKQRTPKHTSKNWDSKPAIEYWQELRRVSKNQIVFGGNYFTENLKPTNSWIFWDKIISSDSIFSVGELIWTSFSCTMDKITMSQFEGTNGGKNRIHPTEKPVALYRKLLLKFAKAGQRMLDTHGGSFSSAVACHMEGYEMDICEIDKEYFDAGVKRFKEATCQLKMF